MKTCLILLSGLPGAGKTTLGLALQQLSSQINYEKCNLSARPCVIVEAVLELDTFMYYEKEGDVQTNGTFFCPEVWRRACDAVREATFKRLCQSLRSQQDEVTAMRLVFLVDTLPYRSMRASYWKMCRDLAKRWRQERCEEGARGKNTDACINDELAFVGMVEVRLNTPLEVCVERNERRNGTSQYIPPQVIQSMSEFFDPGVSTCAIALKDENCWVLMPRHGAIHWPVVSLKDGKACSCLPPTLLAQNLLEALISQDVIRELEKQREALVEVEKKIRSKEQQMQHFHDTEALSNTGWLHQVDLLMRAAVRNYMEGLKKTGTLRPGFGRLVSKCREEHYAQARAMITQQERDSPYSSNSEVLLRDLLVEFKQKLSIL